MKVAINRCFGGFGLSQEAYEKLIEWGVPLVEWSAAIDGAAKSTDGVILRGGGGSLNNRYWDTWTDENRTHPLLIRVIEELGDAANGDCARLRIVEIRGGTDYEVSEYDGSEHIAEKHRTWV